MTDSTPMSDAKKTDKEAELLSRAQNISRKKILESMEAVLKIDPDVFKYLQTVGLSESDAIAIAEQTLRGQSVAHEMYMGMLEGMKQGLERLKQQDQAAHDLVTKWLGGPNA